ncbi:VOC family protein [Paracoccaceae bacterium Fryx2]|nr:VOC family protein [Paracoccaceae bacterium Fryx2]
MSDTHGMIWWSELMTREPEAATAYYGSVAGWTFADMPMEGGAYMVASREGRPVAGIMDMTDLPGMDELPPHWFTYIAVDDVEAAVAATLAAGGAVIKDVFSVPEVGRIAIISDPTGAALGIMTPVRPA